MEKITPEQFKEVVRDLNTFPNPPAVMIFGDPGIGKSYAAKEIAEELKREYIPLSLGRLEAYDIKGMPDLKGDFMQWKPPALWEEIIKAKGNVVLHFDEFTLADENVQGAVLDIIQMKKIDDIKLPDKTLIIISGNMGGDDGTFAKVLTSALTGGRACIFQMRKPKIKEWFNYQKPNGVIQAFLETYPAQIYRGPNSAEPFSSWTCPRSWSMLDMFVKTLNLNGKEPTPEKKKKLIMYAKSILSEDTVNLFMDHLENAIIEAEKVIKGEEQAVGRFLKADNFRQSGLVKEVVKLEIKQKSRKKEKLQSFVDLLIDKKLPTELLALFAEELVKVDPETLTKLKVNGISLDTWADKLTFEMA